MANPPAGWQVQQRPPLMTRRYDFASYAETRQFLDDLSALSEREGYYPDLNFSKTHVNVSIAPQGESLGDKEYQFAAAADGIASRQAA